MVAFINVLHKMSESIVDINELTNMYWLKHDAVLRPPVAGDGLSLSSDELLDTCVGCVKRCADEGLYSDAREMQLAALCLSRDAELMVLVKHYGNELGKFAKLSAALSGSPPPADDPRPDAIVVGTGLAGLAATLSILDRGGKVLVLEKEPRVGGNSAKASSG